MERLELFVRPLSARCRERGYCLSRGRLGVGTLLLVVLVLVIVGVIAYQAL